MTADGRVSYQGRAEIGTRTDRALMFHLRSLADAVMIGAGNAAGRSLRAVGQGPGSPAARDRGLAHLRIYRWTTGSSRIRGERLVATTSSAAPVAVAAVRAAGAQVEPFGETDVDLARLPPCAPRARRAVPPLRRRADPGRPAPRPALVDELFLTHATLITAEPDARRLFEGSLRPVGTVRLGPGDAHERDGERYERSRVRYG